MHSRTCRNRPRLKLTRFSIVLCLCVVAGPAILAIGRSDMRSSSVQPGTTVDPVFHEILPALNEHTKIPVHLPSRLPDLGQGGDRVYAVLGSATEDAYTIIIGFTRDCSGESACRLATLSALPVSRWAPIVEQSIRLAGGKRAFFHDAECGANCSDSLVRWREHATMYVVGIKAGAKADVIKLANAVLTDPVR